MAEANIDFVAERKKKEGRTDMKWKREGKRLLKRRNLTLGDRYLQFSDETSPSC